MMTVRLGAREVYREEVAVATREREREGEGVANWAREHFLDMRLLLRAAGEVQCGYRRLAAFSGCLLLGRVVPSYGDGREGE